MTVLITMCLWLLMINVDHIVATNSYYIEQCMAKIMEEVQPCSERAIQNWNLNHSYFVPSKLSTCCANWEVYECFIQAALSGCTLSEFQVVVNNMTTDALLLQRNNCSRFKYHSDMCSSFSGSNTFIKNPIMFIIFLGTVGWFI